MRRLQRSLVLAVVALLVMLASPARAEGGVEHPPGRHVDVGGTRLWVEQEGAGEPLLLIAGGPGFSHAYFHPWFSELRNRYTVIYFDAYGCGPSDRAETPSSYSFADDVQRIQDNWNDQFRKQMPEAWSRVRALRSKGIRASAPDHQEAYAMPGALLFFRDASNAAKMPTTEPDLYNADVWYGMAGDDADFRVRGELRRFDSRKDVGRLIMPVLVIAGRFDRVVYPELAVRYREYAPRARFAMFENAGHFTFIEAPDATFELLRAFLAE